MGRPVEDRYTQGMGAVYSVAEACRLLPVQDAKARAWLEREGLIVDEPSLGRMVVWADVVARLRQTRSGEPETQETTRTRGRVLPRAGLVPRSK